MSALLTMADENSLPFKGRERVGMGFSDERGFDAGFASEIKT